MNPIIRREVQVKNTIDSLESMLSDRRKEYNKATDIITKLKIADSMLRYEKEFTYEQFANWKWEDVYRWHTKPDIKPAMDFQDKTKTGYGLTYELS